MKASHDITLAQAIREDIWWQLTVQEHSLVDPDPSLPLEFPFEHELDELERVGHERVRAEACSDQSLDRALSNESEHRVRVSLSACV